MLVKIKGISDRTSNKKEFATLKKLESLQLDLGEKMEPLVLKSSTLYQQMLSPTLCGEWDNIVQEQCFTADWINKNDVVSTPERGQDCDTLQECKRLHLLVVCKKDAVERHHL